MSNRRVVWKYPVATDDFSIPMPKGAQILCIQVQSGTPQMWALVDPDPNLEKEYRRFYLVGTGHEHDVIHLPHEGYVGTFQTYQGALIFHLFELKEVQ